MCPQLHVPDFLRLSVVILVPAGITTELLVWRAVEHHPAFDFVDLFHNSFSFSVLAIARFVLNSGKVKAEKCRGKGNLKNIAVVFMIFKLFAHKATPK